MSEDNDLDLEYDHPPEPQASKSGLKVNLTDKQIDALNYLAHFVLPNLAGHSQDLPTATGNVKWDDSLATLSRAIGMAADALRTLKSEAAKP